MQLVEIKKLDLVTSTAAIAEGVGRDHDTIIKLVDRIDILPALKDGVLRRT